MPHPASPPSRPRATRGTAPALLALALLLVPGAIACAQAAQRASQRTSQRGSTTTTRSTPTVTPATPSATWRAPDVPPPGASAVAALRDSVHAILDRAVRDSATPGAYAVVGTHAGVLAAYGAGHLDWAPSPVPDENTMWDLASLTKVVGMTSAMIQLVGEGKVDLDAKVQHYLPEWRDPDSVVVVDSTGARHVEPFHGPSKSLVTVRHLLTHTSGLPAFRKYFLQATSPDSELALIMSTPLDTVPGARMVYSDFGAILAGKIVERVSGERLDVYLQRHVFAPLGMASTMYRPDSSLRPRIAPTEFDPWRGRHVWGEVHDENAYALGGISANAGLFSTGHDLARLARAYLNGGALDGVRVFDEATMKRFTRLQDPGLSNRALGWEKPTGTNSAGHLLSPAAFGHTGFTGTSIWIDPARDLFVILLTNRVNPTRENHKIFAVRSALADAVVSTLDPSTAAPPAAPAPSAPARP